MKFAALFPPTHFCKITQKKQVILEDLLSNFELNQAVISGMVTVYILWYVLITADNAFFSGL